MAAGGDAVKPSGKSSAGIHQHTPPPDHSSPQGLEKSLMLLV